MINENIVIIDRIYTKVVQLREKLSLAEADSVIKMLKDIEEIEELSSSIDTDLDGVLNILKEILADMTYTRSSAEMKIMIPAETLHVADRLLDSLQEIVRKLYLAYIHTEDSYREVLLENIYSTKYEKNALIIYIVYPFLYQDVASGHTNQMEVRVMAEILQAKGFNVDVVNAKYTGELDYIKYDLVIGYGKRFDEFCYKVDVDSMKKMTRICYLTESSPYFSNYAELKRLRYFEKRNGFLPELERQSGNLLNLTALTQADAAICIGNEQTAGTYDGMFKKIYNIKATGFTDCDFGGLIKSDNRQKNFLWYGGAGPIHKGLDLCIEAFRSLPDLNLYIVGEPTAEFYNFYKKDIEESENILYYGFLNKESEEFRYVCENCAFCIAPSCSEGQSTSVITTLFSGIIPVCTKENGLDMDEIGGFWIDDITPDALAGQIRQLSQIPYDELCQREKRAYNYAVNNHTLEHYRENLSRILSELCE